MTHLHLNLIDSLPLVRGTINKNANLSKKSWFGVGGPAEVLFVPEDMDDLTCFLKNVSRNIPITILGAMSNVLIEDGGIEGVVIMLGECFKKIYVEGDVVEVGAGVICTKLSSTVADLDLGGLEFLNGFPGTVGGAIKMSAGCYGSEISDSLIEFEAISSTGKIKWISKKDVKFEYRKSEIGNDTIITRAWFKCTQSPDYSVIKKSNMIMEKRKASQIMSKRSCGSTFKNPQGKRAWELIDAAGCRGMRIGGAILFERHCNCIINDGNASANDIKTLGETIIQKVYKNSGIKLEWEVILLGAF